MVRPVCGGADCLGEAPAWSAGGRTGRRRAGPLGSAPARLLPGSLRKGWVGPLGEEPSREAWLALVPLRTDRLGIQPSVPQSFLVEEGEPDEDPY